jgi:hypothetical protein
MIDLNELSKGLPGITQAFGHYLAEAAAVCLESQGHQQGANIMINGVIDTQYPLKWPDVTEQMLRCLYDDEVATEHGAIGISILLIKVLIGFSVVQRSRKGTGFDYWLGEEEDILFQRKARLEVSGIRNGTNVDISKRVKLNFHKQISQMILDLQHT